MKFLQYYLHRHLAVELGSWWLGQNIYKHNYCVRNPTMWGYLPPSYSFKVPRTDERGFQSLIAAVPH